MKPLFALVQQHKELEQLDPEEIDEETLLATLQGLEGEIALKVQSCAAVIRNMECFAEAVEDAAKKMQARANLINARAEKVKAYLLGQMQALGETKIQTPEFTIKVNKNPPSVVIEDEKLIPAKYKYHPPSSIAINKSEIKKDLENGDVVTGARLHHGVRISIKE